MKILSAILVSVMIANTAFADGGEDQAKYLEQGKPAPFTGFLLTPEKAEIVRQNKIDLDSARQVNVLLSQEKDILNLRLTNANTHINHLSDQVARTDSFWIKTGYFLTGAVLTGLVAVGVSKAIR